MTTPTPADWAAARAVAERHARDVGAGADAIEDANPRVPFLFETSLEAGPLLVHHGAVLTATGTVALGRYLDEAGVYPAHALTLDDVLELLHHFAALPPIAAEDGAPQYYYSGDDGPLAIRFAWRDDRIDLTLSYLLQPHGDGGNDAGDGDDEPAEVAQWSLVLAAGTVPTWTEVRRGFDAERQRLVP